MVNRNQIGVNQRKSLFRKGEKEATCVKLDEMLKLKRFSVNGFLGNLDPMGSLMLCPNDYAGFTASTAF